MTRVLSTESARTSIDRMRSIINTGITEQINQLAAEGRNLSQPEVWDGTLAAQFRGDWEATEAALRTTNTELERLRDAVERINANIMMAGGNA